MLLNLLVQISRRIAPEVENMCFNEQLSQYLEELLKLEPDAPLEEPSAADDQVGNIG